MLEDDSDRIVETATQARAGVSGHNVRDVLMTSTAAAIVVFAVVYLYYFA